MKLRDSMVVPAAMILGLLLLAGGGTPAASSKVDSLESEARGESSPCEQTAKFAKRACKNDLRDDYYTALGACQNLEDLDEADACEEEAEDARAEEVTTCRERRVDRIDLCDTLEEDLYDPEIDPKNFVSPEEAAANPNTYFPLIPGNTWTYENEDETVVVTVTGDTIEIEGVTCIVVNDVVSEDGEVTEDTDDWFAQDIDGNIWYFGEISLNFEDGELTDIEGSWKHGEDYAKAGILIPAAPIPGEAYRQEFLLREAEDVAEVVSITADESSDFADCLGACLQTRDYSPLEPGHAEHKYYVPGLGLILEVDIQEGARLELIDFSGPE